MTDILTALIIGIAAGTIDILPMINQKTPRYSILYIFMQWVVIGLLIPFVDWDIQPWLKGLIIGELGMFPVIILTYSRNRRRIPSIIGFAALLGIGIGILGDIFIG